LFTLNQYPTKVFEGFVRKSRNIIVVKKGKEAAFASNTNKFAKPQNVFFISGTDTEDVLNILEEKSAEIIKTIKASEIIENQVRMKKSLVSDEQLQKKFGISLQIGFGYKYDMVKDNFVWLRKEFTSGYNSILVYQVPIDKVENGGDIITNITTMRDEIGKANIHGTLFDFIIVSSKSSILNESINYLLPIWVVSFFILIHIFFPLKNSLDTKKWL
jgi:hypothetical protein